MDTRPLIAVPIGDYAGVGPEIVLRAAMSEKVSKAARMFAVGDVRVLDRARAFPNMPSPELRTVSSPEEGDYGYGILNVLDLANLSPDDFTLGKVSAKCGAAAYECIAAAAKLAMDGKAAAVSTTPINKESLHAAGVPYIGHTEIFGALTNTPDPLTIFALRDTLVFFLTRHMSLRSACDAVTAEKLEAYIRRSFTVMRQLGISEPTMAVAGLNPHCGEHGLFGSEEVDIIYPTVEKLRAEGVKVFGPIGADSVFYQAFEGRFNSVMSLYHDQGHIATKSVDFYRTVSVTAGMPILRTSVDHGTAFDIAGKGIATGISMEEAVLVAAKYAPAFKGERK